MRIQQITFTRFLAAISIVVFHYGGYVFPFKTTYLSFLFSQANIGVSFFFILSGFVMMIAYGEKTKVNSLEYLKSRFARIYPVYFLAILLLFLYFICTNKVIDYKGLLLNVFVLQAWIPGNALAFNIPGWSLSVEFFFYAVFPFLFNFIYIKKDIRKLIIPIILIWLISQIVFNVLISSNSYQDFPSKINDFLYYFPLMHLNQFLIGNLAGLLFITKLKNKNKNYDLHIAAIIFVIILLLKYPIGLDFHNGLLALLFVPLILLISLNKGIIAYVSNLKISVFLGEISYGIYILQLPVFLWSKYLLESFRINSHVQFYIICLILIAFSGLSYVLFETPLRKIIKNFHLTNRKAVSIEAIK